MNDVIHIETCRVCGGNLNALNPDQAVRDRNGEWRHNTDYCRPADARSRAEAMWGQVLTYTSGNGLESR